MQRIPLKMSIAYQYSTIDIHIRCYNTECKDLRDIPFSHLRLYVGIIRIFVCNVIKLQSLIADLLQSILLPEDGTTVPASLPACEYRGVAPMFQYRSVVRMIEVCVTLLQCDDVGGEGEDFCS